MLLRNAQRGRPHPLVLGITERTDDERLSFEAVQRRNKKPVWNDEIPRVNKAPRLTPPVEVPRLLRRGCSEAGKFSRRLSTAR